MYERDFTDSRRGSGRDWVCRPRSARRPVPGQLRPFVAV